MDTSIDIYPSEIYVKTARQNSTVAAAHGPGICEANVDSQIHYSSHTANNTRLIVLSNVLNLQIDF